jgi:ABC-type branched-subunit amino acid transport system ATPase component
MIEAHEPTKRYGDTTAVHSLGFTIAPGTVTGFLGPNGAGKSTTMRMIMGLDRPTSGTVTVNGSPTGSTVPRYVRSARCWRQAPCTTAAAPAHTCAPWPPPTTSRPPGSARSSR